MREKVLYGLLAEFNDPEDLVVAARRARENGYRKMDAYSPFPIHGLADAIGFKDNWVPWIIFLGGLLGAAIGFGMQWYISSVDYVINVGGRPHLSWPHFIPVTFEATILIAGFAAVFGMFALNGLPQPHHSIFNSDRFDLAGQDRFFLCIEADDPRFDVDKTRDYLASLKALYVEEVER